MYPATIFEYVDQSAIPPLPISDTPFKPMFMAAFTSDKGPEEYTKVSGKDFFTLYGDISFARHGQPLLQAAAIINAGGQLFAKRVVSETAAIANSAIYAEVSTKKTQKVDADGKLLYTDADGKETTEAIGEDGSTANTPVMLEKANIAYKVISAQATNNAAEAAVAVEAAISAITPAIGVKIFPLFLIADTGRGVSNKRFRIVPDYVSSKSLDYVAYTFKDIENNVTLENIQFAINPDQVENGANISLESQLKKNSTQIKIKQYSEGIEGFVEEVANIIKIEPADLYNTDIIFGKTKKGEDAMGIIIDVNDVTGGIDLSHSYGISLANGDNGSFGKTPITDTSYEERMTKVFDGSYNTCIYDLDNYKIDAVVDANYPADTKRAIENFVNFREDCIFLADMGTTAVTTDAAIKFAMNDYMKSKFVAVYSTYYDIIDPYGKKQITVSMAYDIAILLVRHFIDGCSRPLAGILNGFIIPNAIEGTISFIPVITPLVNQKEVMEELRVNYASYYDNILVVESLYTTQEKLTQFSYINNILAIQRVIKSIRTLCPKIRYSFASGEDLDKYRKDVQGELDKYSNNFMSLILEYTQDAVMISNKIFYATIKVQFKNFFQTEWFKVIALPS